MKLVDVKVISEDNSLAIVIQDCEEAILITCGNKFEYDLNEFLYYFNGEIKHINIKGSLKSYINDTNKAKLRKVSLPVVANAKETNNLIVNESFALKNIQLTSNVKVDILKINPFLIKEYENEYQNLQDKEIKKFRNNHIVMCLSIFDKVIYIPVKQSPILGKLIKKLSDEGLISEFSKKLINADYMIMNNLYCDYDRLDEASDMIKDCKLCINALYDETNPLQNRYISSVSETFADSSTFCYIPNNKTFDPSLTFLDNGEVYYHDLYLLDTIEETVYYQLIFHKIRDIYLNYLEKPRTELSFRDEVFEKSLDEYYGSSFDELVLKMIQKQKEFTSDKLYEEGIGIEEIKLRMENLKNEIDQLRKEINKATEFIDDYLFEVSYSFFDEFYKYSSLCVVCQKKQL